MARCGRKAAYFRFDRRPVGAVHARIVEVIAIDPPGLVEDLPPFGRGSMRTSMASMFSGSLPGGAGGRGRPSSMIDHVSGGEKTRAFLPAALRR